MRRVWHCNTYCWFIRKLVFYYGERPTLVWYVKRATASTGPWTMALVITFVLGMLRRWSVKKKKIHFHYGLVILLCCWVVNFFFFFLQIQKDTNRRDSEIFSYIYIKRSPIFKFNLLRSAISTFQITRTPERKFQQISSRKRKVLCELHSIFVFIMTLL